VSTTEVSRTTGPQAQPGGARTALPPAGTAVPRRRRPLWREGDFARLWAGQSVSELGDQVTVVVLPLLALGTLHATAAGVALLIMLSRLAFLPLGLPAGVWVDRLGRRRVMIAADALRAGVLLSLPAAALFDALTFTQLAVVAVLLGVGTVFFEVAYPSYVPGLMRHLSAPATPARSRPATAPQAEAADLLAANTKLQMSQSVAAVAGPGVAGLLVGGAGAITALTFDAATFLVSVATLGRIRFREPGAAPPAAPGADVGPAGGHALRSELAVGLRFLIREPVLRTLVLCGASYNLFFVMVESLLIAYATRTLHLSATITGLVLAVAAVGFPAGTLISGWLTRRLGAGRAIIAGAFVAVSGPLLFPLAQPGSAVPWLIAGGMMLGAGQACFNIPYLSLRQAATPEHLLGRVNAAFRFVTWGALPLGSALAAVLVGFTGLRTAILIAAIASSVCLPILLASPALRAGRPKQSSVAAHARAGELEARR
jgi:MFS family permease